jgi:glycosyltransferase involved in cell wall biosynthesis
VDTELFSPLPDEKRPERLAQLAATVAAQNGGGGAFARDARAAADAIRHLAAAMGPRVVLVGKLIVSKGVDLLLAAWPLVHASNAGARLLVVGFGEYGGALQRLWAALAGGDLDGARELASQGRSLEGGPAGPLRMLSAFLSDTPAGYQDAARQAAGSVAFAGRLEHDEVAGLVPATDALVFPSTFPEAFGMVAAEAAAAGVLPVSAAHSGALEVSRVLAAALPPEVAELVSFPLDDGAVEGIARRLNAWLGLDEATRSRARRALADTASARWSWEGVARGILAASAGRLDELTPIPE